MRLAILSVGFSALAAIAAAAGPGAKEPTVFNGKKVPPLTELTDENFAREAADAALVLVKFYSPYCPHCIDFAPTFQTLYEYYYTQNPSGKNVDADFYKTYDFKFATVNCIASSDLCKKYSVTAYPTTVLLEKGKAVDTIPGNVGMEKFTTLIENKLKEIRPDSRPAKLSVPKPGVTEWPPPQAKKQLEGAVPEATKIAPEAAKVAATHTPVVPDARKAVPEAVTSEKPQPKWNDAAKTSSDKPAYTQPSYPVPSVKRPVVDSNPNPKGVSVNVTLEVFKNDIGATYDPWFVKFYAPWCHHCKALEPIWEQVAKNMRGKLKVGEVNCDVEAKLCKDHGIRGFPTMIFFRGNEHVEYEGLRGLGDLTKFGEQAVNASGGVQDVTLEEFEALEKTEDVIFVYFYDHAATSEDFMALERLPLPLIGRARIVRTRDHRMYERYKITTWPRLLVSREGRPTYYQPLTPQRMRDVNGILDWMRSVWLPIVPELSATNAREVMDGKLVVLGILNRDQTDSYQRALKEIKKAAGEWMDKQIQQFQLERQEMRDAKQLRIEEAEDRGDTRALRQAKLIHINMNMSDRKQVTFAWVDGVFWQRWIRATYGIDVTNGERVVITDEDNKQYWDETITGNPIVPSRTSILETLGKVTATPPKLKPKLTISSVEKLVFDVEMTFVEHPLLCAASIAGFCLAGLLWFRGRPRRGGRGGYFKLDDLQPASTVTMGSGAGAGAGAGAGGLKSGTGGLLGLGGVQINGKTD